MDIFDLGEFRRKKEEADQAKKMVDSVFAKMSDEQKEKEEGLIRGKNYRFSPPTSASGFVRDSGLIVEEDRPWKAKDFSFEKGVYLGVIDGKHVFEGVPLDDEEARKLFFRVIFDKGSKVVPDEEEDK